MKLWVISQRENNGYDTYSDAVVAAKTEEEARRTPPHLWDWLNVDEYWEEAATDEYGTWATKPENVSVVLIGTAVKGTKAGVILASFRAG
jgi:hypothetical protein